MTKAITCTVIGRLIHDGWLRSVHDPAPAPLWSRSARHPSADHAGPSGADAVRPWLSGADHDGRHIRIGFENSAVYQDAADAFDTAQRSIVATVPGSVFRYVNSGMNVLGSIIRDQIERRGLPYHETAYGLLADRLGMSSYQHSADIAGNLIALRRRLRHAAGLREAGRAVPAGRRVGRRAAAAGGLGRLRADRDAYRHQLRRLLPHAISTALFPDLPDDTAWASGASDQRIFILRRQRLTVAVANETDHPMDHRRR